jgi:hypothetical protein
MEAKEETFEVVSLLMGQVHGMIHPSSEATKELPGLSCIPHGAENDLLEKLRCNGVGTGKGGKETPFPEAARRLKIDLLVAPGRPVHILPGFGEGGGIENDQIERLFCFP